MAEVDFRAALGAEPDVGAEHHGMFTVFGYNVARTIHLEPDLFSNEFMRRTLTPVIGPTMMALDPPLHSMNRNLVRQAFTAKSIERWKHQVILPTARECVQRLIEKGAGDIVTDLAAPLAMRVITRLLGLPDGDADDFERWAIAILSAQFDPAKAKDATAEFDAYCGDLLTERRLEGRDDLVLSLVRADTDGRKLTDEEVLSFIRLVFPAGVETTFRTISNVWLEILRRPWLDRLLREDPLTVNATVDECMRLEPTVGLGGVKMATQDIVIDGVEIPRGASIYHDYGTINRDPSRWDRATEFDIARSQTRSMAWGAGIHVCLGEHLARLEILQAIHELLAATSRAGLTADDVHVHGVILRGACAVPVEVTAL